MPTLLWQDLSIEWNLPSYLSRAHFCHKHVYLITDLNINENKWFIDFFCLSGHHSPPRWSLSLTLRVSHNQVFLLKKWKTSCGFNCQKNEKYNDTLYQDFRTDLKCFLRVSGYATHRSCDMDSGLWLAPEQTAENSFLFFLLHWQILQGRWCLMLGVCFCFSKI